MTSLEGGRGLGAESPAIGSVDARWFDPVAVVGMACRLPGGVQSPDDYWNLLSKGRDVVGTAVGRRAPSFPQSILSGTATSGLAWGAFLDQVDEFDAGFFGISGAEARFMDPQQRILMEVAWEALESAGIDPSALEGTSVGVFIGSFGQDYELLQARQTDITDISPYFGSGVSRSMLAGRLSYRLGVQGPSMMIDTACSSSLVALHLAVQSLRRGECDHAIVGGVNLVLAPEPSISYARAGMLAADGRCKTFSAEADGYVRGEGCAVVVLRRQSDALLARERIWALVRGSAVNQDGASNGLTAPSAPAQVDVIRAALLDAQVDSRDVSYVEAHGTGTPIGDVVEASALAEVYGGARGEKNPLIIASGKTNLGHTEAASGVVGIIKTILSLSNKIIPAHLHLTKPNPSIDFDRIPAIVPTQALSWDPPRTDTRIAGINSFGFSGTNAHVIIEEAPPQSPQEQRSRSSRVVCLSAPTQKGLVALAKTHLSYLEEKHDVELDNYSFSLNAGRKHFSNRFAVAVDSMEQLRRALKDFGIQRPTRDWHEGKAGSPRIGFVYTGQGSQYERMGRGLIESQPDARRALDACDSAMRPHLGLSVIDLINGSMPGVDINNTRYAQPALFALQYALTSMWRNWGVSPHAVLGHSIGEYAAACAAGTLQLEDAARLVVVRGELMAALPGGAMLALAAGETVAAELVRRANREGVGIAAVNGPNNTVVAGDDEAIEQMDELASEQGIASSRLAVSHAFHSAMMQGMSAPFALELALGKLTPPAIDFISTLSGKREDIRIAECDYWTEQVVRPVRFMDGVSALIPLVDVVIEIGPSRTAVDMARKIAGTSGLRWIPSLVQGRSAWHSISDALASLEVTGAPLAWSAIDGPYARERVALPSYPFQRQNYWFSGESPQPRLQDEEGQGKAAVSGTSVVERKSAGAGGSSTHRRPPDDGAAASIAREPTIPRPVLSEPVNEIPKTPAPGIEVPEPHASEDAADGGGQPVPTIERDQQLSTEIEVQARRPNAPDLEYVSAVVRRSVAELLEIPLEEIDFSQTLVEIGIDSFLSIQLADAIFDECGFDMDVTQLLERMTISEILSSVVIEKEWSPKISSSENASTNNSASEGDRAQAAGNAQLDVAGMDEQQLDAMILALSEDQSNK